MNTYGSYLAFIVLNLHHPYLFLTSKLANDPSKDVLCHTGNVLKKICILFAIFFNITTAVYFCLIGLFSSNIDVIIDCLFEFGAI